MIADKDIRTGDILFKEKAFAFAPIFLQRRELVENKCYYCLCDIINPVL